jgi:hypothetical protein
MTTIHAILRGKYWLPPLCENDIHAPLSITISSTSTTSNSTESKDNDTDTDSDNERDKASTSHSWRTKEMNKNDGSSKPRSVNLNKVAMIRAAQHTISYTSDHHYVTATVCPHNAWPLWSTMTIAALSTPATLVTPPSSQLCNNPNNTCSTMETKTDQTPTPSTFSSPTTPSSSTIPAYLKPGGGRSLVVSAIDADCLDIALQMKAVGKLFAFPSFMMVNQHM